MTLCVPATADPAPLVIAFGACDLVTTGYFLSAVAAIWAFQHFVLIDVFLKLVVNVNLTWLPLVELFTTFEADL